MHRRPILVTGSHRSGSTWIGRMIEHSLNVRYIHEPFNTDRKKSPLMYSFEYVSSSSDKEYQEIIKSYIESFYSSSLKTSLINLKKIRSIKRGYHFLIDYRNRFTKRTLLKDPIAIMSAEWLYETINCDVIVTIRHPAAFIASLKVLNWEFDFNNFLDQKNLMFDHFDNYKSQIIEYSKDKKDIINQGILLWNTLYSTVFKYQEKYGDQWYFVRHEDISRDPVLEFEKIFSFLDLEFKSFIIKEIINSSSNKNETELKRDSIKNIKTWKERLSIEEIELIKEKTNTVWKEFYNEEDWY